MSITAAQVRDLRERTGVGMMDCKKALVESNGDFEEAVSWLRKKGLSAAAKKADRVAAEGLVAVVMGDKKAVAVEINSETDFVARNETFQNLVSSVAQVALDNPTLDALKAAKTKSGKTVDEYVTESVAVIGENLALRRVGAASVENGVVVSYIHNAVAEGLGKIAVLVALESGADKTKLEELGKQLAMHVAAARPLVLKAEDVDADTIQREKDIAMEKARAQGKPEQILEKIAEGSARKFCEEVALLNQTFVMDNKSKISEVVAASAKELGAAIELKSFVRLELGEGVSKEQPEE